MKRIILLSLLTIALLAPGITKAQYTIPNQSFETWTTSTDPANWVVRTGQAIRLTGVSYIKTTNGVTQNLFRPAKNGTYCLQLQNKTVGTTLQRGIMQDSFAFTGRPQYFAMNYAFLGASGEQWAILMYMTKWNTTTNSRDTVLNVSIASNGVNVEPWNTLVLTKNIGQLYKLTDTPDTCRFTLINTIGASSTPSTSMYIDEMWFSDNAPSAVRIPETGELSQGSIVAYPNPFSGKTNFHYSLSENGQVSLKVYDISGREVSTVVDENQAAGTHEVSFTADGLKNGLYFYRLQSGNTMETGKLILNK